jgi:hypothetical protein
MGARVYVVPPNAPFYPKPGQPGAVAGAAAGAAA